MSNNKSKHNNHPKPIKKLIDNGSTYSPNSIGGRIDLEALREKLFCQEVNNQTNQTNHNNNVAKDSSKSLQGKGKA